jgi:hypothetical protein
MMQPLCQNEAKSFGGLSVTVMLQLHSSMAFTITDSLLFAVPVTRLQELPIRAQPFVI